ncbi:hypothetical protein HGA91_04830 [candidate division WWE3 bacterium]|nr:hypothetical protein [candidate division WWE3 bacterium]
MLRNKRLVKRLSTLFVLLFGLTLISLATPQKAAAANSEIAKSTQISRTAIDLPDSSSDEMVKYAQCPTAERTQVHWTGHYVAANSNLYFEVTRTWIYCGHRNWAREWWTNDVPCPSWWEGHPLPLPKGSNCWWEEPIWW